MRCAVLAIAVSACTRSTASPEAAGLAPPPAPLLPAGDAGGPSGPPLAEDAGGRAFPELENEPGWVTRAQHARAGGDLWWALAVRDNSAAGAPDAAGGPWADTRLALVQQRGDMLTRVAASAEAPLPVPCDTEVGPMGRDLDVALGVENENLLPGETLLPLHVRCYGEWPATEAEEAYQVFFRRSGDALQPVLVARVEQGSFDRVSQKATHAAFEPVAQPPTGGRPRVCMLPIAEDAGPRSSGGVPRRGPCYTWDGKRFAEMR